MNFLFCFIHAYFSFVLYAQIADEQRKSGKNPLAIKKMYVLGGLLVEQYHETMKLNTRAKGKNKQVGAILL